MGQCLNEANMGEESKDEVLGLMPRGKGREKDWEKEWKDFEST